MNQLVADLKAARKLIEKPENWCKGYPESDNVTCAMFAVGEAVKVDTYRDDFTNAVKVLTEALPSSIKRSRKAGEATVPLVRFNDAPSTTHADILKLFDRAIARAEQQP